MSDLQLSCYNERLCSGRRKIKEKKLKEAALEKPNLILMATTLLVKDSRD
jgi:hypothetical protein